MQPSARKIEIFAPFGEALDLTKAILFQPFDAAKWCVIGFTAFLAGLADGTRFSLPNPMGGDFRGKARTDESTELNEIWNQWFSDALTFWVFVAVFLFVIVIIVLFSWLSARGRFMFIDCIVRNRGAVVEPWHEWRREGNKLFGFTMAVSAASLVLLPLLASPFLWPWFTEGYWGEFTTWKIVYAVVVVLLLIVAGIFLAVVMWFAVPVMYRQRCGVIAALRAVLQLVASYPLPMLLFGPFVAVLILGGAIVSCLATCLTCCLAAIPYVGTVILLPLYVFYYSYSLLFLRQFGPEYDVWGEGLPAHLRPPPSAEPPPLPAIG